MKLQQILESIHDSGKFKAVFLGGMPGSGKSTITQKIKGGNFPVKEVNTDRGYEFILKKNNIQSNDADAMWNLFGERAKTITKEMLFHYINGMFPLFVDGTSSSASSLMKRTGIIESIGYDAIMVWVDVSLETAIERVANREKTLARKVPEEFIRQVYSSSTANKEMYQRRFGSDFYIINNDGSNFNAVEGKMYNAIQGFLNSQINNPIGRKHIQKLEEQDESYLVPLVYDREYIERLVSIWYNS